MSNARLSFSVTFFMYAAVSMVLRVALSVLASKAFMKHLISDGSGAVALNLKEGKGVHCRML